eukprot:scaffold415538_cov42-Prasinocladus_malaysianus.AAC.1
MSVAFMSMPVNSVMLLVMCQNAGYPLEECIAVGILLSLDKDARTQSLLKASICIDYYASNQQLVGCDTMWDTN